MTKLRITYKNDTYEIQNSEWELLPLEKQFEKILELTEIITGAEIKAE